MSEHNCHFTLMSMSECSLVHVITPCGPHVHEPMAKDYCQKFQKAGEPR